MPRSRKKTGPSSRKRARMSYNPPEECVVYTGPARIPKAVQERETVSVPINYGPSGQSGNGSGAVLGLWTNDPSGYQDWSSLAAVYDEYRVLSMTVKWLPVNRYNQPTNVIVGTGVSAIDRDDVTSITTEAAMLEYGSAMIHNLADPWTRTVKMAGIEDALWVTTATPKPTFCIKFVSQNNTASVHYGNVYLLALCQFRGRN